MSVVHERWTVDDLLGEPSDGRRRELVDGTLVVSPPASQPHQWLAHRVARALEHSAPPGWLAVTELPLVFGDDHVRVPDVTVHRWPLRARGSDDRFPLTAADIGLVVEVVSPTSSRTDRDVKPVEYAAAAIPFFWLVDPSTGLVLAHQLVGGAYREVTELRTPWGVVALDVG